jgi:hypothetical protein
VRSPDSSLDLEELKSGAGTAMRDTDAGVYGMMRSIFNRFAKMPSDYVSVIIKHCSV